MKLRCISHLTTAMLAPYPLAYSVALCLIFLPVCSVSHLVFQSICLLPLLCLFTSSPLLSPSFSLSHPAVFFLSSSHIDCFFPFLCACQLSSLLFLAVILLSCPPSCPAMSKRGNVQERRVLWQCCPTKLRHLKGDQNLNAFIFLFHGAPLCLFFKKALYSNLRVPLSLQNH